MKRFVVGDIHGRFHALKEVLKISKFNYKKDKLVVLGDVADGGYNTYEVVEELLKINNLIYIIGNHDEFFLNHIKSGWAEEIWIQQGGGNTLRSYGASVKEARRVTDNSLLDTRGLKIPVTHQHFFNTGYYYYVEDNMVFVHGGFIPGIPLDKQKKVDLVWDRELIRFAKDNPIPEFDKVFVGHTTTQTISDFSHIKPTVPLKYNNLWCMDTGAGWNGKLSIMNIDTEKYWQSKPQEPAIR